MIRMCYHKGEYLMFLFAVYCITTYYPCVNLPALCYTKSFIKKFEFKKGSRGRHKK